MAPRPEIVPTFDYDPHGDVLYISLGRDDEPYYVENVDDFLLVQRHMDTSAVTGFQFLGVREHSVRNVRLEIRAIIQRAIRRAEEDREAFSTLMDRVGHENLSKLIPSC